MNIAALAIIFLVASSSAQTCLTSSEEFAAEVVIPNHNFARAQILGERVGSSAAFPSQYAHDALLVLLSQSSVPKGMSVKVQRPTTVVEVERPYLRFVSYSLPGLVRTTNLVPLHAGWAIECQANECAFEKDFVRITASRSRPEQGVTFEITESLESCGVRCEGLCVTFSSESRCFSNEMKHNIDTILRYANITTIGLQEAFTTYRLVGTEGITLRDIAPKNYTAIDWEEAFREELVYLDAQGLIEVSKDDIEQIALLAREGQAGHNYRIVFDEAQQRWMYYDKTLDPVLSSERDCRAYDLPQQSLVVAPTAPIDTFYLIPLIFTAVGIIVITVLIVIARVLTSRHARSKKRRRNF